jgi:hypothetical protein
MDPSPLEPAQEFVQRISDAPSSLRVSDEPGTDPDIHDAPTVQMSDLLSDSGDLSAPDIGGPGFDSDITMHHLLDMMALAPTIIANDNPATPVLIDDAVRQAMPDLMVDQLIDAFTADTGSPANDMGDSPVGGRDVLAGLLDQGIDAFHFSPINNNELWDSHQYDLSTATN